MAEAALRYLDRATIIKCGVWDFAAAVADVEEALRLQEAGEAVMPLEVPLRWSPSPVETAPRSGRERGTDAQTETAVYALPAYVGGTYAAAGIKWTAHRPDDALGDLPRVMGVIVLNDGHDGRPIGVLESALIGAVRTAATSAVAIRRLRGDTLRRVAIVGAGLQADTHLRMLAQMMPNLEEVLVANRTPGRAREMVAALQPGLPWSARVLDSPEQAFAQSDVVITCTAANEPFVQPFWVHSNLVAVHVGPYEYTFDAIAAFDRIIVDHWGEFKHTSRKSLFRMYRAGRLKESDVWADLTDLVLERKPTRPGDSVFVNVFGLSIFDVAVSARILRTADRMGVGRVLPLYGREENRP